MEVDDFKSWVHELARDSFPRAADKTNVLNRIENSGNDDNFKRLLFADTEWKNTLEDVATCVQQECEDNVKKLGTRSKAFRSTMQDVWQWMIKMELQAPHADIDAGLYLDALQKLLQHNGDIWKDQHRGAGKCTRTEGWTVEGGCFQYLDSIKLCKEILDHYSTDDVDLGDFNDLLVQSLANFQTAVASGARSEQYVVAELLEVLTKNLRFVQLDQPITAIIAQFAQVFFAGQLRNPARTVLLHIAYLLFVDFSHLYRKELVEGFAPVFRTLFGNVIIGEKSSLFGNDHEQEEENRDFISVSCKFFEIFVTVAFPFSVIDGFERMEDLRAPCEHFSTFLQRALTAQIGEERPLLLEDIGVEYLPIICEIFTHFRSSLDPRIEKRLVKCGCIPAYINTLATILSQDYSFIDDSDIKSLYQRAINWLHIPLANESASKLIMAVLQWMPKRFGAEVAAFFDSALKSVCRLTQFTKQTIRLLTHVFRDDLAVEGAWKFRKQLIALMLREVNVDVDCFSNLLLSLLFIEPRAVEGEELEERKHDDVLNVEEDLRWTLSDPLPLAARPLWRTFTIFCIKLLKFKEAQCPNIDVTRVLELKKEEAIKQPRVPNGEAIGKIVTILFGKQKLVGKIRMLKRFGRFLDAREYSALASALITEVETVTQQPEVSEEYAKFLRQVLCSEIILCADRKVVDFKQQFDYLTKTRAARPDPHAPAAGAPTTTTRSPCGSARTAARWRNSRTTSASSRVV
ncbi:hypothetical protein M3Y99_00969100 [Aphelenchoides fujianensis]|nr:hypothetical protein M3Y99_00969100 [Aphelenchoides fujianensis]